MARNSSGSYSLPPGSTAVAGAVIDPVAFNTMTEDIANEITGSLPRNGSAGMSAPLLLADGSVTNPALVMTSEPDRGLYKTANGIGVSIDGVKVAEVTSAGVLDGAGNPYQTAPTVAWVDQASGATVDLSSVASENIRITGTTTITALDDTVSPAASGVTKTLRFAGALTLTHNSTTAPMVILPTAANITTAAGDVCTVKSLGSGNWVVTSYTRASGQPLANVSSGKIGQIVESSSGAVATTAATIPYDDTIPQNTEGAQFYTVTITPSSATSTLLIEYWIHATGTAASTYAIMALFQDSTANALDAGAMQNPNASPIALFRRYKMAAGTTSATTFKLRAGPDSVQGGTLTINGVGGSRLFGGVLTSGIRVTEILP